MAYLSQEMRWWRLCLTGLILSLLGNVRAQLNNETSPTHQFKSRPDLHAPIIDMKLLNAELVEPGYVFLAPYRNVDPGPYIYDNWGNLVWSGAGLSGPRVAHTPRVYNWHGEDHLFFFTGEQHQGFSRGHGVIMDKHYRTVKTIEAVGAGATCDMHEFRMTPFSDGKSILSTVYQPRAYDLTTNPKFNIKNGIGWVVEGVFQEIEIDTGRLLFEWRSLDHIDPGDSWTMPHTTDTSGDGTSELHPWDYVHLNSIDKNMHGDYLISARHTSAIYKISGKDGSIIWTLGGSKSDFEMTNFMFSYQHHARWISETADKTVFSFYDNGSNGFNHSAEFSHSFIVEIDHPLKKATMTRQWGAPDPRGGLLAGSQGSMQVLPNGNVHTCWGEFAFYSEHTWDCKPVMYAQFASRPSNVMHYRSNKFNWTAEPITKPALWTYSKYGDEKEDGKMVFYASWNGATEVRSWKFFTSDSASGPWSLAEEVPKKGFETVHHLQNYSTWAYAQAVDGEGRALQDSVISRTFVPSEKLRKHCGDDWCDASVKIEKGQKDHTKFQADVEVDEKFLSTNRGFNTMQYYHGDEGSNSDIPNPFPDGEASDTLPAMGDDDSPKTHSSSAQSPGESQQPVKGGASGASGWILLFIGMAIGYAASIFVNFMRYRGFGSGRSLGKYQRVLEKDDDEANTNSSHEL